MQLDGQTLRQMRKRRGMSQDALSRRLHMSRSNISKLESGKLEIRGKDLLRWVQETNAQDMLIAIACQVDLSAVTDMVSQLSLLAGTILIGWCF
ncbi:helix-turn-helix transcriptional regulator [Ornithinibacillus sp. JPR2-1]|uniref:helix-turn-helix domain-containing protein n=1 Tax=Ornithinibacillus sp. JPR2-1 TaxID=2094019 RepID=UPI0031DBFBA3